MAIRVAINHKTTYDYDRLVSLSPHIFRLRPAVHSRIPIESYSFKVLPKEHFINWQQDPFGNYQARVVFPEKTRQLSIEVEVIANMVVVNPFDFFVEEYAEKFPLLTAMNCLKNCHHTCKRKRKAHCLLNTSAVLIKPKKRSTISSNTLTRNSIVILLTVFVWKWVCRPVIKPLNWPWGLVVIAVGCSFRC